MASPLWQPSAERAAATAMRAFAARVESEHGVALPDAASLHRWSIDRPDAFWRSVWEFCGVIGAGPGTACDEAALSMPGTRWFPQARLNFAENLLRRRDASAAVVFRGEDGSQRSLSWSELHAMVASLAAALRAYGVAPGDRVAGLLPNVPEAVAAMLATATVGAIWSSCSPDFGARGVLDRFGQIEPRVLFGIDGYRYNGRHHDVLGKLEEVRAALPSVEHTVLVPFEPSRAEASLPGAERLEDVLRAHPPAEISFSRLPFDHPLYILYSSGTTGAPKCIVHGAGGTLLQHLKEQRLHVDVRPDDRIFYFTTLGWMMWNWLASALASEATLLLYDGAPMHPDPGVLFRFAEEERMTILGTSAKFIDALAKSGYEPRRACDLSSLRSVLSTGSPLSPEGFEFVYEHIHPDVHLASISGGTDIVSCFVLGDPTRPVWPGEIQSRGLGMAVEVFDDAGRPVRESKGELVCTRPFPSMPIGFWNDPDGARYHAAYFERFPGVWAHGDFAEITEHDGIVIHGRSDAVLNPGGVRIGTAEIYRQVEQLPEVMESLVVGQEWQGDVRVVLFVVLREGELDDALRATIARQIRSNTTPRHVPARIVQVADIPRTRSGKIVELAVRDVVHGRPVRNREALANPEALELFASLEELSR